MNGLSLFIILVLLALSATIGGLAGVTSWLICLYLSILFGKKLDRPQNGYLGNGKLFLHSFIILSAIGYLLTLDNLNNFGTEFGFAIDDERYFQRVISLANNFAVHEYGLFERVFGGIAWILEKSIFPQINLNNLLPFSWLFAAFACCGCHRLACQITKKDVPHWIIYLTLLLNCNFVDAMIRFYREAFLYSFYVWALILIDEKRFVKALFPTIVSGSLRGANAIFLVIFSIINFLSTIIRSRLLFVLIIISLSTLSVWGIKKIDGQIINYVTDYSRITRYEMAYYGYSLQDRLENRQRLLTDALNDGSITSKIYNKGGVLAFFAKPVVFMFFPLTLEAPISTKVSHSSQATKRFSKGLYYFNIYRNLTIFAWIFVFPLLTIGLIRFLAYSDKRQILALYFLTCLFLVANLSGQLRHGLVFIVLIPCFVAHGREIFIMSPKYKQYACFLSLFMFLSIFSFNIIKIFR